MSDFEYECPECSKCFPTFEETCEHCLDAHDIEIETNNDEIDGNGNSNINSDSNSNSNIDIKHSIKPAYVPTSVNTFEKPNEFVCKNAVCKSSGISFKTFDDYEEHLNITHGAFKCIGCNTRYKRKTTFENHINKFHEGVEPTEFIKKTRTRKSAGVRKNSSNKMDGGNDGIYYSCRFCPKIYATKNSLQHHYSIKHENDESITSNELDMAIRALIDMHV